MNLPVARPEVMEAAAAEVRALNLNDASRKVKALVFFVQGLTSGHPIEQLRARAQAAAKAPKPDDAEPPQILDVPPDDRDRANYYSTEREP